MAYRTWFLFSTVIFLCSPPVFAALGEKASSVQRDAISLAAIDHGSRDTAAYRVHEMKVGATLVREYISNSGIVFGVAWTGPAQPNLRPLLGTYMGAYESADERTPRPWGRGRSRLLHDGDLVVEKWGHFRKIEGRAYTISMLPKGVKPDEIK